MDHLRRYPMRYINPGQYPTTSFTHGAGTSVTTTSIEIVPANWQRFHVHFQNQGTGSVWINLSGAAAVADSTCLELVAGSPGWWAYTIPGSAVNAIASAGTHAVATEWAGAANPPLRLVANGVQVVAGGIPVIVPSA